jgi:hypothetical protein
MRASDLIGLAVVDEAGQRLGVVVDLRCVQDGPPRGMMATIRVDALLVAGRRFGTLLGYARPEQRAPWLIATIVSWLNGPVRVVPWSAVAEYTGQIALNVGAGQLGPPRSG